MAIDMSNIFGRIEFTEPFSVKYLLYQFWHDIGDRRTDSYFLVKSGPLLTAGIIGAYLLFCTYIGPLLMRNRKPLELRRLIFFYNVIMVLLNLKCLVFSLGFCNYGLDLFVHSANYDRDDYSPQSMFEIDQIHQLIITKFIDLFDTIFFVLRKKQNNVSVLHLYHHSIVPVLCYLALRLMPTFKPMAIFAVINCFIHVIMYSYYALASFGPAVQKYLWWKKYITQIQLAQFVVYIVYGTYMALFVIKGMPFALTLISQVQSPLFFLMFYNFYRKSYSKSHSKSKRESNNNSVSINNGTNNFVEKKIE